MASLIFSHSKSILNKSKRDAHKMASGLSTTNEEYELIYNQQLEMNIQIHKQEFIEVLELSSELHQTFLEFKQPTDKRFFITIRPDDKRVSFELFRTKVLDYLSRKCFVGYTAQFEQKGVSEETLGEGFHVHIVAKMKQRSKPEVLRDTLSSWKGWIEEGWIAGNCIQVEISSNGEALIQNYLIEYKSDDEHKMLTLEWDEKWRQSNNLKLLKA
jgi:hypothetical protein